MSNPTRSKWSVLLIVVMLIGAIGLLTWLMPTSRSRAAVEGPGSAAFISPIGDPQLSVRKQVDNPAPVPGSVLNYTLSYSNTNPGSTAFAVRLYDFLPAGVQFLSSNPLGDTVAERLVALHGAFGGAGNRKSQRLGSSAGA